MRSGVEVWVLFMPGGRLLKGTPGVVIFLVLDLSWVIYCWSSALSLAKGMETMPRAPLRVMLLLDMNMMLPLCFFPSTVVQSLACCAGEFSMDVNRSPQMRVIS